MADVEAGRAAPAEGVPMVDGKVMRKVTSDGDISRGTFDLKVTNLTYKVSKKVKKVVEEKVLLNSVNAHARHGQILAVVGPSGAGKSTFLDAIAGRISTASLEGEIEVNGKPVEESFKRQSGYVMQDDELFPMLSVRETLLFSARLRLPSGMAIAEKKERVEMLIHELGLESCADTVIGNAEVRGVSGGEKRRVSIGVDLIHDPAVLFLDEPTSGLDSTAALNVVQILHDIAEQRRRTIILTIHQPSFRILDLIHNFLILARGNVIYHGPYPGMLAFFKDFGREVPEHVNGLEFALDLIEEEQKTEEGLNNIVKYSQEQMAVKKELGIQSSLGDLAELGQREYANNFFKEIGILSDRNFKNILRTPELFVARIGLCITTGLVLGSLFWQAGYNLQGVQNRLSFFAFALALLIFTSGEGLPIFLAERQIYIRETSRGAYRTISYVIAGAVVFLPFLFILATIFSSVSYFMVGLAKDASAFFTFVTAAFLALAAANSFVMFFAAFVPNFIAGNTLVTATTAFFFLFSGFFIKWSAIPKYWIWFNYLSLFKYPLQILSLNEFNTLSDVCWESAPDGGSCIVTSAQVLYNLDYQNEKIWWSAVALVGWFFFYRILFYIALRAQTSIVRK